MDDNIEEIKIKDHESASQKFPFRPVVWASVSFKKDWRCKFNMRSFVIDEEIETSCFGLLILLHDKKYVGDEVCQTQGH